MATVAERKAHGPDLFQAAHEVACGSMDAELAAQAGAAGSVADTDELSARDKRMLAIGTLTGAAAAIARARFPFESSTETLERADAAVEYACEVEAKDRDGRPLFVDEGGEG